MRTVRTFIAIELDAALKQDLRRVQRQLDGQLAPRSVRWVREQGIHLTLKFLGDTPLDQVDEIAAAVAGATVDVDPIDVVVGGLGCFPNTRRPRVIWVGLKDPSGELLRLQDAVEVHVSPLGYPRETRPFRPHLTLGRVHRQASKPSVREVGQLVETTDPGILRTMTVDSLSFIRSDLKPSGAVYTTLLAMSLGAV